MMIIILVISGFGILSAVAPSYGWLVFFRGVCGFGIGGANIPFDLLSEFMPASHRGQYLVLIEGFWIIGSLFVSKYKYVILM